MAKESIFLSGWEYNRLLADEPSAPRQSGLPGAALWNGSAQFWLFKKVYCTKESLDGEITASESIGYAQGKIFDNLRQEGFLDPISWSSLKESAPGTYKAICSAQEKLKVEYPEKTLRDLVQTGKTRQLDEIKFQLLAPVLQHLRCIQNVSPNSVQHWLRSESTPKQPQNSIEKAIEILIQPVTGNESSKLGLTLCHSPGTHSVTMQQMLAQREVEQTIQKRQIAELYMGDLSARDYLQSLEPHAHIYRPINEQLITDWNANREKLYRLRDLAEKHIWKDLHGEWLPRLETEPLFHGKFLSLLNRAIRNSKMAGLLDLSVNLGICFVGGAAAVAGGRAGLPSEVAGFLGASVGYTLKDLVKAEKAQLEGLTLFYQKARELKHAQL